MAVCGRVVDIDAAGRRVLVHAETTRVWADGIAAPGDLVEIEGGAVKVVRSPGSDRLLRRALDPRRVRAMATRDAVEEAIRAFFRARDFREVRTPILVPCPGMEPHIRPFRVGDAGFLHTSPEFAMKRLLVAGLPRIFQMATVFRDEPDAPSHRREFVMLEWYRAWADEEQIMRDVEDLFAFLGERVPSSSMAKAPWPRLRVRDLFAGVGVDLVRDDLRAACARLGLQAAPSDTWDDLYFRIWLSAIEPTLPAGPLFVTRYPASQAALAVVDEDADGSRWARRFEVYAGGLELGNAFYELTDHVEQRRRFVADQQPGVPLPEELLAALEDGMPPSAGIAMGVDRIAMLFAGEDDIGYLSWL
jgi:lysyl-tRNA synthetase class 2